MKTWLNIVIIYCDKQIMIYDSLAALLFDVSSSKFRLVETVGTDTTILWNLAA